MAPVGADFVGGVVVSGTEDVEAVDEYVAVLANTLAKAAEFQDGYLIDPS
jgi:hypothetical protein